MVDQRFEHAIKRRYYRITLSKDLLGDWVITRVWGGIGKANGRITHLPCASYDNAIQLIHDFAKIRKQKGYQLCHSS